MNLCAYLENQALAERLSLLAGKAGWYCTLSRTADGLAAALANAYPAADLVVSDHAPTLARIAREHPAAGMSGPPLVLLHDPRESGRGAHAVPGPRISPISSSQSDEDLLQALRTCVNARRFRDRFAELERSDPITRLPHHDELFELLAREKGRSMGLLVVQIDHAAHLYNHLDPVSKTDLLAAIGEHIRTAIPESALLGFYDAACFVVALPHCQEAEVAATAGELVSALRQPLRFKVGELHLTVSIGFNHAAEFEDPQRLWTSAWRAMRAAVESGGNRARGPADGGVSRRLRGALERDEFSLVLQPQMTIDGGRLTGAEALLRWQGMEVGELAPDHFIPVAEQRGHMAHLGDWVLDNACREAATWFEHLLEPLRLGVNISPLQFRGRAIVERIGRYRSEHWFDPGLLELELSHEAMLALVDDHREQLYQLRDWGVRFALDGLGSSLIDAARLLRCPADTLKIDRAVISRVDVDPEARELAAQICQLGERFDVRVVAVGVERDAQQRVLSELGCSDVQGFLYSPPVSLREFRALLAQAPALATAGH